MPKFLTIAKIITGIIIFLGFFYISYIRIDPDLWWHLRVGGWELQNKAVPHLDAYSYTMPGFEWVNHEWLVDAALWRIYSKNLWWLLAALLAALSSLPFFFWLKRSRSLINTVFLIFISICILGFVGVRSQMISFALFFLVFEILYKKYVSNDSRLWRSLFYGLPFIFFAWANLHAGFFSGLILWGLWAFVYHAINWWRARKISLKDLKLDGPLFFLSAAAALINPYGWKLYKEIFTVMFSSQTAKYILEWQPALSVNPFLYISLIAITAIFLLRYYKKYSPGILAVCAIFMILFLKSVRMGPFFFVTLMPIFAEGENFFKSEIAENLRKIKTPKIGKVFVFFSVILCWISTIAGIKPFPFPEKAVDFLREKSGQEKIGNVLNSYGWGGYLIFNAPEIKVFIDGRMPHWTDSNGNSAMDDYAKIFYAPENNQWQEIFQKRKINTVLFENEKTSTSSFAKLAEKYLPSYTKQFIQKSDFLRKICNLLGLKKAADLKTALLNYNWEKIYEDETATILKCRGIYR